MCRSLFWLAIAAVSVLSCQPADQAGSAPLAPAPILTELAPTLPSASSVAPAAASTPTRNPTVVLKSGITFTATLGPTCPGPQREGEVCTAPYEGEFIVTRSDGGEAARFTTGVDGRAVVDLLPGSYTVATKPGAVRPLRRGGSVEVKVLAGQYTAVILELDTGIR